MAVAQKAGPEQGKTKLEEAVFNNLRNALKDAVKANLRPGTQRIYPIGRMHGENTIVGAWGNPIGTRDCFYITKINRKEFDLILQRFQSEHSDYNFGTKVISRLYTSFLQDVEYYVLFIEKNEGAGARKLEPGTKLQKK